MSSKLVGTWDLESSENWEEYMKELGVGLILRKAAGAIKPIIHILNNGKEWTFQARSTLKNMDLTVTEDVEFDETTPDGTHCKSIIHNDGQKIVHEQKDAKKNTIRSVITREIDANDRLIITYVAGSVTCKRTFKRRA